MKSTEERKANTSSATFENDSKQIEQKIYEPEIKEEHSEGKKGKKLETSEAINREIDILYPDSVIKLNLSEGLFSNAKRWEKLKNVIEVAAQELKIDDNVYQEFIKIPFNRLTINDKFTVLRIICNIGVGLQFFSTNSLFFSPIYLNRETIKTELRYRLNSQSIEGVVFKDLQDNCSVFNGGGRSIFLLGTGDLYIRSNFIWYNIDHLEKGSSLIISKSVYNSEAKVLIVEVGDNSIELHERVHMLDHVLSTDTELRSISFASFESKKSDENEANGMARIHNKVNLNETLRKILTENFQPDITPQDYDLKTLKRDREDPTAALCTEILAFTFQAKARGNLKLKSCSMENLEIIETIIDGFHAKISKKQRLSNLYVLSGSVLRNIRATKQVMANLPAPNLDRDDHCVIQ